MGYPYSSGDVLTATDLNVSSGLVRVFEGSLSGGSYSIDNCFSSTFDNYKVTISDLGISVTTTQVLRIRFRNIGGDDSSAFYAVSQYGHFGSTSFNSGSGGQTSIGVMSLASSHAAGCEFDIQNPFLGAWTVLGGTFNSYQSDVATAVLRTSRGVLTKTNSYAGMTVFTSGGTLSGTINIYGYGQA